MFYVDIKTILFIPFFMYTSYVHVFCILIYLYHINMFQGNKDVRQNFSFVGRPCVRKSFNIFGIQIQALEIFKTLEPIFERHYYAIYSKDEIPFSKFEQKLKTFFVVIYNYILLFLQSYLIYEKKWIMWHYFLITDLVW